MYLFIIFDTRELESASKLEIVWGKYVDTSLKLAVEECVLQNKPKYKNGLFFCRTTKQEHSVQVGEAIQTEQRLEDKLMWQRTGDTVVDELTVLPRRGTQPFTTGIQPFTTGVPFTTGIQAWDE